MALDDYYFEEPQSIRSIKFESYPAGIWADALGVTLPISSSADIYLVTIKDEDKEQKLEFRTWYDKLHDTDLQPITEYETDDQQGVTFPWFVGPTEYDFYKGQFLEVSIPRPVSASAGEPPNINGSFQRDFIRLNGLTRNETEIPGPFGVGTYISQLDIEVHKQLQLIELRKAVMAPRLPGTDITLYGQTQSTLIENVGQILLARVQLHDLSNQTGMQVGVPYKLTRAGWLTWGHR